MAVLSPKKDKNENKNRKDYATEKWEQEVRDSIAQKKSTQTGAKLSRADQALVTSQLAKEADIRKQISTVQARLQRGTELVRSLVAANSEAVSKHLRVMAEALLNSAFGPGNFLVDERVFSVFLVSFIRVDAERMQSDIISHWPRSHMTVWASTGG